jgi:hypothetical protein
VHHRNVRRRNEPSLHERMVLALSRAARAQDESRVLIAECRHTNAALRDTLDTVHRGRSARAAARPDR